MTLVLSLNTPNTVALDTVDNTADNMVGMVRNKVGKITNTEKEI